MLIVEHFVAPSPVHGLGVFARYGISKGALVWQAHPDLDREITREVMASLPEAVVAGILTHAEYLPQRDTFRLSADGSYYMNHSDAPNLVDDGDRMFAAREILPGEELLCDYREVRVLAYDPDAQAGRACASMRKGA